MALIDLALAPIYLVFIYFVAYAIKASKRKDRLVQKYFIPALTVRIIGSTAVGLVYSFYYTGGDTQTYFYDGLVVSEALLNDPLAALKIIFTYDYTDSTTYPYISRLTHYRDPHSFSVSKTVGVINFFTFGSYTVSAFFFALLSLSGSWALFVTFCKISPELEKQNAVAALFLPSVIFWGAGILKDTLTYAAMGWFVYGAYMFFIEKKNIPFAALVLVVSGLVMHSIKIYILISIVPAMFAWIFLIYTRNIKNPSTRKFIKPVLLVSSLLVGIVGSGFIAGENSKYQLGNLAETSNTTSQYIKNVSINEGGSVYDLGTFDPSVMGTIKMFLPAVNVTLFRPYFWEIRNVLMLFSSIESFTFLLCTLLFIYRVGFGRIIAIINKNPFLLFCLIFSIVFAFAVGVSTYNFGSLVRYKIPVLPFYAFLLFSIYHNGYKERIKWRKQKLASRRRR